jgi:hypothetical protein
MRLALLFVLTGALCAPALAVQGRAQYPVCSKNMAEFRKMVTSCTPYICTEENPFTGEPMLHVIKLRAESGECLYGEQMMNNQQMVCTLTDQELEGLVGMVEANLNADAPPGTSAEEDAGKAVSAYLAARSDPRSCVMLPINTGS